MARYLQHSQRRPGRQVRPRNWFSSVLLLAGCGMATVDSEITFYQGERHGPTWPLTRRKKRWLARLAAALTASRDLRAVRRGSRGLLGLLEDGGGLERTPRSVRSRRP